MSDTTLPLHAIKPLIAAVFLAGCGGALERAETALERGDAEVAVVEAFRAVERERAGAGLTLVDALILAGRIDEAVATLDELEDVPSVEARRRLLVLSERSDDWRTFAQVWLTEFEAGETHAAPGEAEFLGRVLRQIFDDSQGAAIAMLESLPSRRLNDVETAGAIDFALDQALYQMHYRRESAVVGNSARALALVVGDRFVLRKHELASRLTRESRSLRAGDDFIAEHALQVAGSPEQLAALALEFSGHGATVAGAVAFEIAADADQAHQADWLRGAASARYLAGERDEARALLERAAISGEADSISSAFDVALRHRDESHEFEFVKRASDAPCELLDVAEVGEALRARTLVAARAPEEAVRRITERLESCPIPGLAATVGMTVLEAGHPEFAEPLLYLAAIERFDAPDLVRLYLPLAANGAEERGIEVARLAAGSAIREPLHVPHTLTMFRVLWEAGVPAIRSISAELLMRAVELQPDSFEFASELAGLWLSKGDQARALLSLDRYLDAAPDRLVALLGVARWLEGRIEEPRVIAEAYERAARHPEANRNFETLGNRTAAEHAWSRAAHHYMVDQDASRTAAALWLYAAAAGAERYATWDTIWSTDAYFDLLAPVDVIEFGEVALRAGLEESRVQLRLGTAYEAQGDDAAARDAYISAVRSDDRVVDELMMRLRNLEDNETLIAVLHAIRPEHRPYAAWVALANAHAVEAARTSISERRRAEHRVDARRAFWSAMSANPGVSFRAHEFADSGLYDLAAHLHRRDLEADPSNRTALQLTLISLAEAGASPAEIEPLLDQAIEAFDEAPLGRLRSTLARRGYLAEALRVGQRQLVRSGMSTEGLEATAAAVIGHAIEADRLDLVRSLTHEYFAGPAGLLASPDGLPPARYVNVADRYARAAALLRTASGLYETAGLWALSEQSALDALRLTRSHSHQIVARCVLSAIRARGGELPSAVLGEIADAAGGSAQEWRLLATILGELERPALAQASWERVLSLVPDDWSALLELGAIAASQAEFGRADALLRDAVIGARPHGRDADTAIHAARAMGRAGRADLAIGILELVADTPRVDLVLADFELGAGLTARALRRLASASLPPAETIRVYLRHGHDVEGVALWERRVRGLDSAVAAELVRTRADVVFAQLPFSRAVALLVETAEVSDLVIDPSVLEAEYLARAGRPAEAAAALEELQSPLAADDRTVLRAAAELTASDASLGRSDRIRRALADGDYERAVDMLTAGSASLVDPPPVRDYVALARSGFDDEAYSLLLPLLELPFRADAWHAAISVRSEGTAEATVIRQGREVTLALGLVRALGETGALSAASELLRDLPLVGPDAVESASALATAAAFGHEESLELLRLAAEGDSDPLAVWTAADDLGLTEIAAVAAQQLGHDEAPLGLRFSAAYLNGDAQGALDALLNELATATHPISVLRGAIDLTSPTLDPGVRVALIRRALAEVPGDIELLLALAATEQEDDGEDGVALLREVLECNPGGTAHAVHELFRRGRDARARAVARGCEDLPVRARVVLELSDGAVPTALDGVQPRHAVAYAAEALDRGNLDAAEKLSTHAAAAIRPPATAFVQRAMAHAGYGDLAAATSDAAQFLSTSHDLLDGGPELLEGLAAAGAYEAVDLVANALQTIPDGYDRLPISGSAAILSAFAGGAAVEGLTYLEHRLTEVHRSAALHDDYAVIASLYAAAGQTLDAITLYEQRLELWPDDYVAMNNLAFLLAEEGDRPEEAVALALRSVAWSGRTSPSALDTLSRALFRSGEVEEAHRLIQVALRALPRMFDYRPGSELELALLGHLDEVEAAMPAVAPVPAEDSRRSRRRRSR